MASSSQGMPSAQSPRVHCLTTGLPRPDNASRRDECLDAGVLLNVDRYTFSAVPDTRFAEHRGQINADLFTVFDDTRPDIVYTHYPEDQHRDHSTTALEVTTVAQRTTRNLYYFHSPYSIGFEPTLVFMGNPELLDVKARALKCFPSQHQLDMDVFQKLAEVEYRRYVHHRVVADFPEQATSAELFVIARRVEFAFRTCG